MKKKLIFTDKTGKRKKWLGRITLSLLSIGITLVVLTIAYIYAPTTLPSVVFNLSEEEKKEVYAFITPNDPLGIESLRKHLHSIDVVLPDALSIDENYKVTYQSIDPITSLIKEADVKIVPTLPLERWKLEQLIQSDLVSETVGKQIVKQIQYFQSDGVNIELAPDIEYTLYLPFLDILNEQLSGIDKELYITVQSNRNSKEIKVLSSIVDKIIVKAYDPRNPNVQPALPPEKLTETLLKWSEFKDQVVIALPTYTLTVNEQFTDKLSFTEVMPIVNKNNSELYWDNELSQHYFSYLDHQYVQKDVWLSDAGTFFNQLQRISSKQFASVAIDTLGFEDPSIWKLLNKQLDSNKKISNAIETTEPLVSFKRFGSGEIIKIDSMKQSGKRSVFYNTEGFIENLTYEKYPVPYEVFHMGGWDEKKIVLSFDDGPSEYTLDILNILKEHEIRGGFFRYRLTRFPTP